jgi:hypothetical protein
MLENVGRVDQLHCVIFDPGEVGGGADMVDMRVGLPVDVNESGDVTLTATQMNFHGDGLSLSLRLLFKAFF